MTGTPTLTAAQRDATLDRFQKHREAWGTNAALRTLYGEWYGRLAALLPPPALGPRVEIGSGPGFAREFVPDLELSDVVKAAWHDREISASALPFDDASVGALVLFDVLHHLPSPADFFREATRVLRRGGRVVMCEPHMSLLSYPVYKFLHEEPVRMFADALGTETRVDKDPFDANQAIPTVLFGRQLPAFQQRFPALRLVEHQFLAGLSYPASGGFSRQPLLPGPLWSSLYRFEQLVPSRVWRFLGFRTIVVLEKDTDAA